MGILIHYGQKKRIHPRVKRELRVDVKTGTRTIQVYSIDLSAGGIKVAGAKLCLIPGEQVELVVEKGVEKFTFQGGVERADGSLRIKRIGRDGNAFFVRILDERLAEFVKTLIL